MSIEYVITFAIVSLAVYRISDTIARDEGPADVFRKIREYFPHASSISKGLRCPFCISFYVGFAGSFFLPFYGYGWFIVTTFALSAITSILLRKYG